MKFVLIANKNDNKQRTIKSQQSFSDLAILGEIEGYLHFRRE